MSDQKTQTTRPSCERTKRDELEAKIAKFLKAEDYRDFDVVWYGELVEGLLEESGRM